MCFSDLRQLLSLFVSWDWTVYLADYGTGNEKAKYLRVKPKHALIIFDKLKEGEKKSSFSISMMNKKDRDKKKLMDTIYKQLKALSGEGGSGTGSSSSGGGGGGGLISGGGI
ncbi:Exocyst complex component [Caligus rogercresseyi]|uniref:Exocyst complex component n=1 Tax=Caligus rogercresseyi TaxID=217165 RepID=A0A7T8QVG7_CALRO|nr:Exocyst complex component [Caligus rogercresseyi]